MIKCFFKTPKAMPSLLKNYAEIPLCTVFQTIFLGCLGLFVCFFLTGALFAKDTLFTKNTVFATNTASTKNTIDNVTIKITNSDWPPYQSPNSPYFGAISHLVTEIFKLASIKTDYHFLPDSHALSLTQQGKYDATFLWSFSKERERYFYFSEPIITVNEVIVGLSKDSISIERYEDLIPYKIGIVSGYFYGQAFNQASEIYQLKLYKALTIEENLARLLAGKVDFIVGVPEALSLMLRQHYSHLAYGLQAKTLIIHQSTYHVLFSKASKNVHKWRQAFNRGYAIFKENQRIQTIFRDVLQGRYDPY